MGASGCNRTPGPDSTTDRVDVPSPPSNLAGRWNGGPGDSSDWYLTVGADGSYTLINDSLGWTDSGQVDATAGGFTMYNATGDRAVADAAGIGGCD